MSELMRYFYNELGTVTDEMEQTQFGINFIFSFVRTIKMINKLS